MDERKKLIVTLAIMIGIAVVVFGILIYQMHNLGVSPLGGADSINAEIAKADLELNRLNVISKKDLPEAVKRLEELDSLKGDAAQLLPVKVLTEEVLRFINAKAEEAQVEILGVDPTKAKKASSGTGRTVSEPYEEKIYRMIVSGSYDQIALFINYMEMFELSAEGQKPEKRFFNIKDITLESQELGLSEDLNHVATLDIATYEYVEVKSKKQVKR